ncbi:MAG: DUF378 domain-containing protein [Candidatus Wildermuthbacteria bacterium]|nr:DUF378 domain-containing protein [Candidatus Wildermuthbacteria bacterium]
MKMLDPIATLLLVVGGINWALVAFMDVNIVTMVAGTIPMAEQVVYGLVGASAVYVGITVLPKQFAK